MAPIGDQGSCQSCAAFAVAGALEWYAGNVTGHVIPLSTQFLVDCIVDEDTGEQENGCDAGIITTGLKMIMRDQYMPYEADYPFLGSFDSERCEEKGARLMRNALADVWVHQYVPLSMTPQAIRTALQTGPTIHGMYVGDKLREWKGPGILTDNGSDGCTQHTYPHAMSFVGWQSNGGDPYYIVRNSYGVSHGDQGYLNYADNTENENCRYAMTAYSLVVGPRREIEYKVGAGKKNFKGARQWCQEQGTGWDLAHVPTEMHNLEVYDMFTEQYGTDKKNDATFNFFWIGLYNVKTVDNADSWVWVEGDYSETTGSAVKNFNFANNHANSRFGVMNKVKRGLWDDKAGSTLLRFMCSRYREEACPRISHTAVNKALSVTFLNKEGVETLEIEDGTMVSVTCMEGYKVEGEEGSCKKGAWKKLPVCFSENPCNLIKKDDINKSKKVTVEGLTIGQYADEGSTVTVTCKNGYDLVQDDPTGPSVCTGGEWVNLPECVKAKKTKKSKTNKERE